MNNPKEDQQGSQARAYSSRDWSKPVPFFKVGDHDIGLSNVKVTPSQGILWRTRLDLPEKTAASTTPKSPVRTIEEIVRDGPKDSREFELWAKAVKARPVVREQPSSQSSIVSEPPNHYRHQSLLNLPRQLRLASLLSDYKDQCY